MLSNEYRYGQLNGLTKFFVQSYNSYPRKYSPTPGVPYGIVGTPNDPYEIIICINNQPAIKPWPESVPMDNNYYN